MLLNKDNVCSKHRLLYPDDTGLEEGDGVYIMYMKETGCHNH